MIATGGGFFIFTHDGGMPPDFDSCSNDVRFQGDGGM
jgi:hypothetical protein